MIPTSNQRFRKWLTASWRSLAALALAASAVGGGAGVVAVDAVAGKNKAEACAGCHGEKGISEIENTPSLAGQPDLFIQWQLIFFRAGARKSEVMGPIAEQLSNDDVRDLGAYFASLKPPDGTAAAAPDDHLDLTEAGKKVAAAGRCASCHGEGFAGSKAVARIAGQHEEYITKALHDYKSGLRSGGGVAAMAEVAYPLNDDEITALAHYLARF
jgi:cytochrome c553